MSKHTDNKDAKGTKGKAEAKVAKAAALAAPDARKAKADKIKQAVIQVGPKAPEGTKPAGPQASAWPDLVPLGEHDLPAFPLDVYPQWLRDYIEAVAESTQTPPDLGGMLGLTVLSAASAKRVRVGVKDDYAEPVNLYTIVSLPPASRKSAVFGAMAAPLEAWEAEQRMGAARRLAQHDERLEIEQGRLKMLRKKALDGRLDEEERRKAGEEAVELACELAARTPPDSPRLVADDATPEKLTTLLAKHGGRMALLSPEGGVFDIMAGRYSGAPNLDPYLKGHCGDTMRVDRQGRPSEEIHDPALTVGLTVQPDVLSSLGGKPGFRGRGLLARFLYALPEDRLGQREVDTPPVPGTVKEEYGRNVKGLLRWLEKDAGGHGGTAQGGRPKTPLLALSAEARAAWLAFAAKVEHALGPQGHLRQIADWGGKLPGAVARIAGLLHLADHAGHPSPWDVPVSADVLSRAVRVADYLIPHALAAFEEINLDPACQAATHVFDWVIRKGVGGFSQREVFQALKGRYKRVALLEPGLSVLKERGYLGQVPTSGMATIGRPRGPHYVVNPAAIVLHQARTARAATPAEACRDLGESGEAGVAKAAEGRARGGRKSVRI